MKVKTYLTEILEELRAIRTQLNPKPVAKPKRQSKPITSETWIAYESNMLERYSTKPPRNAKNNALIRQFVDRVGKERSPDVIRYYVWHNDYWYVKLMHPLTAAVRDAEKLVMEYESGKMITHQDAMSLTRRQSNTNAFKELLDDSARQELSED